VSSRFRLHIQQLQCVNGIRRGLLVSLNLQLKSDLSLVCNLCLPRASEELVESR
jgi:hypothetical protein